MEVNGGLFHTGLEQVLVHVFKKYVIFKCIWLVNVEIIDMSMGIII